MKHASLSASTSSRWMNCPGSVNLCLTVPKRPSSPAAEEGTAAHEAAALCLQEGRDLSELIGRNFNGFEVDEAMVEALQVYVDYVTNLLAMKGQTAQLFVEKKFDLSWLRHDMWGTNDSGIAVPNEELTVIDLKFGMGVLVEVAMNPQLLYYGLGALHELNGNFETVKLVIVQPRARHKDGPIREFVIDVAELEAWGTTLAAAADATRRPDAPLVAGEHCRWCDASGVCPELAKLAFDHAKIDFAPLNDDAEPLSVASPPPPPSIQHDLERAMFAVPVVEQWCKNVQAAAQSWLEAGQALNGFKLVRKKSNRVWKDEEQTLAILKKKRVPPNAYLTTPKLLGPAPIEKAKLLDAATFKSLVLKPDGGLTVAQLHDPRPEAPPPVLTDFSDLGEDDSHLE